MVVEAAGEGLPQGGVGDAEPSSGQLASILGSRWPATWASSMARPETPKMSVATVDRLDQGVHPAARSSRWVWRVRSAVRSAPSRVSSRSRRIWARGTNQGPSMPRSLRLAQPHRIQLVGLGPARQVLGRHGR
jgi:hypothetical protein